MNLKSDKLAGIVAGAAFVASAGHIISVVNETNPWYVTPAYPVGIDGLIYVGIRAVQAGRKFAGMVALGIGAAYSLAFNAHAEGAIEMSPFLIAASMPVCMFAAFLIESTSKKSETAPAAPIEEQISSGLAKVDRVIDSLSVPAVAIQSRPAPMWIGAGARHTLPIIPKDAPKPVRVKATVETVKPVRARTAAPAITASRTGAGRPATWDVEKAVRLISDGRTNAEVAEMVGTNEKAIQRTRRVVRLIEEDASTPDSSIATTAGLSEGHVSRVRAAM